MGEAALLEQCEKTPVEVFSAYNFLHDSQAHFLPGKKWEADYPCLEATLGVDDVNEVALTLQDRLKLFKSMGLSAEEIFCSIACGDIFYEAAAELLTYHNGARKPAVPDHPLEKGVFNMSLLWYLASFNPNYASTDEEFTQQIISNTRLISNYDEKFKLLSKPYIEKSGNRYNFLQNGINGFDNEGSSMLFYAQEFVSGLRYTYVLSEIRRIDGNGEFNLLIARQDGDSVDLYMETVLSPHVIGLAMSSYSPSYPGKKHPDKPTDEDDKLHQESKDKPLIDICPSRIYEDRVKLI